MTPLPHKVNCGRCHATRAYAAAVAQAEAARSSDAEFDLKALDRIKASLQR